MNFFDGEVSRRRAVSLRGQSGKQENSRTIVERARQERASRERQRIQEEKAIILQRHIRGFLDIKRARILFKAELDKLLKTEVDSDNRLRSRETFDNYVMRVLRLFLFISHSCFVRGLDNYEQEKLFSVCRLLLKWMNFLEPRNTNSGRVFPTGVVTVVKLLGRLYATCIYFLSNMARSFKETQQETTKTVISLCCLIVEPKLHMKLFGTEQSLNSLQELLDCAMRLNVYQFFRAWILSLIDEAWKSEKVLQDVFYLMLEPLKTHFPSVPRHRREVFLRLFSMTNFSSSLSRSTLSYILSCLSIRELVQELATGGGVFIYSLPVCFTSEKEILGLLGNLMYLNEHILQSTDKEDSNFMASYVILLGACVNFLKDRKILMDGEEFLNLSNSAEKEDWGSISQHLLSLMKSFFKIDNIRKLFRSLLFKSENNRVELSTILSLCKFTWHFSRLDSSLEHNLITALAFWPVSDSQEHILSRLWPFCGLEEDKELFSNNNYLYSLGERSVLFTIFCRAFTRLVYFQDNEEFYQKQKPFSLEKVKEIASLVKQILFRALWSTSGTLNPAPNPTHIFDGVDGALEATARLLAVLHSRDSKQRFTKDGFWEAGNGIFFSDSFIIDAAKSFLESEHFSEDRSWFEQMDEGFIPSRTSAIKRNVNTIQLSNAARNILRLAPFMIPFESRLKIFHYWIEREREQIDISVHGFAGVFEQSGTWVTIRRGFLVEDAFAALNSMRERLKQTIRVKFIDSYGLEEAGIDGGGVFKEFMHELVAQAFSPSHYGLFRATTEGKLYPNPASHVLVGSIHLEMFEFLGRILGKALFDRILVDLHFATFFLSKLLGEPNYTDDLESLDPEMYKNLMYLKHCDRKTVEEMSLTFTIMDNEYSGGQEVPLVPNGESIPVTVENRIEYINRVAHYRMNVQIRKQCDAFLRGLCDVVQRQWIRIFSPRELQLLISGATERIDLIDMKRYCHYSGGYHEQHPVIQWFWEVFEGLGPDKQSALLQFVTSSPRAPLLGFRYLNPAFTIHQAEADDSRLPTASTCMNLLKLPKYSSKEILKKKLLYALETHTGFNLS
eukprot:jgi/Galph1/2955/GphlegSOOS_G1625.1